MVQHLGDPGGLAAGKHRDLLARLHAAGGDAPPEDAAALGGVREDENFSTHCTGKAKASVVSAGVTSICSSRDSSDRPW